jgi:hypothetical protein
MFQERLHFYDRHVAGTVKKILNRNGFGEGIDTVPEMDGRQMRLIREIELEIESLMTFRILLL